MIKKPKKPETAGALVVAVVVLVGGSIYEFLRFGSFAASLPGMIHFGGIGLHYARTSLADWQRGVLGLALAVPASAIFAYQIIAWKKRDKDLAVWAVTPSVPCFFIGVVLVLVPGLPHYASRPEANNPPPHEKPKKKDQAPTGSGQAHHKKGAQKKTHKAEASGESGAESSSPSESPPASGSSSSEGSSSEKNCGCGGGSYGGSGHHSYGGGSSGAESHPTEPQEPEEWEEEGWEEPEEELEEEPF